MTNLQGNVKQPEGRITNQISGVKKVKRAYCYPTCQVLRMHFKIIKLAKHSSSSGSIFFVSGNDNEHKTYKACIKNSAKDFNTDLKKCRFLITLNFTFFEEKRNF